MASGEDDPPSHETRGEGAAKTSSAVTSEGMLLRSRRSLKNHRQSASSELTVNAPAEDKRGHRPEVVVNAIRREKCEEEAVPVWSGLVVLPKLPVPDLDKTLQRYLAAVTPIVSDSLLSRTRASVAELAASNGVGRRLQERLLRRKDETENWAYEWWLRDMYLANPLPLPINSNPGMVFPPREFSATTDMARLAARILAGILEYKHILDRRALPLERATSREKGQPLCMAQYYRLLTSCRIPGRPADILFSSLLEDEIPEEEHVIVACRSQLYEVQVKVNGRALPEEVMAQQMMRVLQEAPSMSSPIATPPIGLLTAERRDTWADVRAKLRRHETNVRSLEKIERALMIVCFDEPLPLDFNYSADGISLYQGKIGHFAGNRDETNMAHQMLHGGGSFYNSGNRWFDKTVQFVITSDGVCGLCYEHSPSEGIAVVQLMEKLLKNTTEIPFNQPLISDSMIAHPPQRLQWIIEEEMKRNIKLAAQNIDRLKFFSLTESNCMGHNLSDISDFLKSLLREMKHHNYRAIEDLDFYVFRFTDYGKEFIKSCRVSPDAYIQLALQLAYYRLHNCLTATYESASTRRFLLGRVDCIRSATVEALEWVRAMVQAEEEEGDDYLRRINAKDDYENDYIGGKRVTFNLSNEKRRIELMEAALRRQTEITIENILGEGIDIHLLGLREAAKEAGELLPMLYRDDEAFRLANHFSLSTSQVPMTMDCFMGYGPVVPDGYGASYCPHPESIVFCLSAFRAFEPTDTWRFSQSLSCSLKAMSHLMQRRAHTGSDKK